MLNLKIYDEKQPDGSFKISNKSSDVERLALLLYESSCNIMADYWCTDIIFVSDVKSSRLSYVGTVRKNKRQFFIKFVMTKSKSENFSLLGFSNNGTLVNEVLTFHKKEKM